MWFHNSIAYHACKQRDEENEKRLFNFIANGDLEGVEHLLETQNINVNLLLVDEHCKSQYLTAFPYTRSERLGPLAMAIRKDDLPLATVLLRHGADPNYRLDSVTKPPLFAGVASIPMLELLIQYKAGVCTTEFQGKTLFTSPDTFNNVKKYILNNM